MAIDWQSVQCTFLDHAHMMNFDRKHPKMLSTALNCAMCLLVWFKLAIWRGMWAARFLPQGKRYSSIMYTVSRSIHNYVSIKLWYYMLTKERLVHNKSSFCPKIFSQVFITPFCSHATWMLSMTNKVSESVNLMVGLSGPMKQYKLKWPIFQFCSIQIT